MPSGHDTLNSDEPIDERISESYAMISTWDGRKIDRYESLGRATRRRIFKGEAVNKIMENSLVARELFCLR
jgi:hypothetical protein